MKKIVPIIVFLLMLSFSSITNAMRPYNQQYRGHHKRKGGGGKPVGAPLDGGLLAILGAAGVSYGLIRRKKKLKGDDAE